MRSSSRGDNLMQAFNSTNLISGNSCAIFLLKGLVAMFLRRICVVFACFCLLGSHSGCVSKIKEPSYLDHVYLDRSYLENVEIKNIAFNNADSFEVFRFLNSYLDHLNLQHNIPKFVLSPDISRSKTTLHIESISLGRLMEVLEDMVRVRFIWEERWIVVAPVTCSTPSEKRGYWRIQAIGGFTSRLPTIDPTDTE